MTNPVQTFHTAILAVLGHAPESIEPGRLHRFSTSGRRGDTAGWAKLFDDGRAGVFGCHRSGISEVWTATTKTNLTRQQRVELARQVAAATAERQAQQRQQWAAAAERNRQMWAQCVPLTPGDPVVMYLRRRGFGGVWPLPEALRLHPALDYWHDGAKLGTFPAMVAPLTAPDGRVAALHRTYLTADGRKAMVPTAKKLTGAAGPLAGASIPLHAPRAGVLGVCEGIETALAAWCASRVGVAAAYCANALAEFRWPTAVQRLLVFADADRAGREAAEKLRARAAAARLRVEVLTPADDGSDWADVWAARAAAEGSVE